MISPSFLKKVAALTLFSLTSVLPTFAESVATVPVGYISINLPDGSVTPKQVAVYFGLTDTPAGTGKFAGLITGVTTNTVTVAGAGWTPGTLSAAAAPYFIRFTSGTAEGTTWQISTTTPNTMEVATLQMPAGVTLATIGAAAGHKFEIFPADTLSTLFGTALQGGTSTSNADVIEVWNGSQWLPFFYNSSLNHWVRSGSAANQNNFVIRPDQGLLITRRGPAKSLVLVGRAPSSAVKVRFGNNKDTFIGLFPKTGTLLETGIQNSPGWVANVNETLADKVTFWNGGQWLSFYFDGTNWRRVGNGQITNTVVQQPERPFLITKGTTNANLFASQAKPY